MYEMEMLEPSISHFKNYNFHLKTFYSSKSRNDLNNLS